MFEKEAEEKYCKGCKLRIEQCLWAWRNTNGLKEPNEKNCSCKEVPAYLAGAEFGYNKANEDHEGKCKTAYIKGIRTMANALKDYDRTDGAWTDYFEHTVDKVLNKLLKESE